MLSNKVSLDSSGAASFLKRAAARTLEALRFYSRLPVPALGFEREPFAVPDLKRLAPSAPLAGAIIGACGAIVLLAARALALPPLIAAALALSALILVTGGLHEDGLADVADGFGGGATRERKLEIMRDSRLGAYGAAALVLSLLLRAAAVAALTRESVAIGAGALILAGAISRACSLAPIALLDPARSNGAGASVGRLGPDAFGKSVAAALAVSVILGLVLLGLGRALLAFILAWAASVAMTVIAKRQIGGQTGDVAGAAQQLAEIACLVGLLIGFGSA
ncbi:MAG TPA: adenosylcobinamide-GDP ribazoletransferase [Burkholderiales bacterium]|nr:adenosylcobinamide-GDP ribazoletransferase [Burkholderiales bacterium]